VLIRSTSKKELGRSGGSMDIDIADLKKKYRKRPRANIVDMEQLQTMVPMLIREICRLEEEVERYQAYVKTLEKKRLPDTRKGSYGKAEWIVSYDMKKNRLMIKLIGVFDYKTAKMAANAVTGVLENVEKDFDVINDITDLEAITDMRTLFHLRKVRYLIIQAGVKRTVRIDQEKESLISSIFKKHFQQGQDIIVVKSLEDANAALENDGKYLQN